MKLPNFIHRFFATSIIGVVFASPVLVAAQWYGDGGADKSTVQGLVNFITVDILNAVVALLSGLAIVYFIAGMVRFIKAADNEQARESGKNMMIYGVIGLFVLVSVWGLVRVLVNTFGFSSTDPLPRPKLPE